VKWEGRRKKIVYLLIASLIAYAFGKNGIPVPAGLTELMLR
jgi:hypothetical protein